MTKYLPNSAFLQSLPECELLICFDETPAHLLGRFNSILADRRDRLYFANLEGDILVLEQGNMPIAEADTGVLTATTPKAATGWLSNALRTAQDRMESYDTTALDTFARIVAASM
jgi:hypothetical protein